MELISMTDYILSLEKERLNDTEYTSFEFMDDAVKYANFLKQPIKLEMFVPCDEEGRILEPLQICCDGRDCGCMGMPVNISSTEEMEDHLQAEGKVLFKGFVIDDEFKEDGFIFVNNDDCDRLTFDNKSLKSVCDMETVEDLVGLGIELKQL